MDNKEYVCIYIGSMSTESCRFLEEKAGVEVGRIKKKGDGQVQVVGVKELTGSTLQTKKKQWSLLAYFDLLLRSGEEKY